MRHLKLTALALTFGIVGTGNALASVMFQCPAQLATLERSVPEYLRTLKISTDLLVQTSDAESGVLTLSLTGDPDDKQTLDFSTRAEFMLATERVRLPVGGGKFRHVDTVSKKEIVLAMLQHGRSIIFAGDACSLDTLKNHVGVRQNIVAWAENLNWDWPDGGPAKWNKRYWNRGTPKRGVPAHVAVMDAFLNQDKYAIGCYTAAKLVVVQGTLDYYRRVMPDPNRVRQIEDILLSDGEPLVDVEPSEMWRFEKDFDATQAPRLGKLLALNTNIAKGNFVPGDWGYLLNTDLTTAQKTGYEGSNAIYMGRNKFDDFYNDHGHSSTYEEKLEEVYQWRNGVFNRVRDKDKRRALSPSGVAQLGSDIAAGGLQIDTRLSPNHF
jgi:hypothetical protein